MTPSQGPEGTPVTLSGAALAGPREILFGGVRATSVLASSFGSIKVLVPSGAKSGPVTVVTAGGRKDAPASFTVVAGTGTQDLQIAGMYVTQAIQRMDGSIPLVAGREGRLRVFLACSGPNALSPMVRVTVWDASGAAVLTRDIPAPFPMVPMAVEESDPLGSWDVTLPGSLIQPGMTVQARILPLPGGPALDPARSAFPAGGPMALEVRQVAPLGITLIPVNQGGTTGLVTNRDRSLESWLKLARKVYPLGEVDIRQGEVFTARESLLPGFDLSYSSLRNDLDRARIVANPASRRYHVGVFRPPFLNTMMGIAQWSTAGSNLSRSCLVWDGTAIGSSWSHVETLAHELGHNLLRRHSNCGIDHPTEYPYPDAELGAYGFDVETGESFHPKLCKDLMSYCNPYWVSDHTYQGVLEDRAAELPFLSSPSSPKEGLLVSGIIRNGKVTLDPAFEVDGVSDQPDPGNYLLRLKDALGNVIQETSFAPTLLMDFSFTEMVYSFCFAIPLTPAIKAGLGSMEVVPKGARAWAQAGPSAALFTASPRGTSLPRDPVAVVWHPGTVHLSWDGETHPQVMVRNAATGAAIGLVEGGSAELVTEAGELDLDLSSGLSSVRTRVKVAR
jgi:hypothetical protein